jgi:multisubunit Na+/H+ antiporter MnhG subunit
MVVIISILVTLSWFLTNPVNANLIANVIQSQNKSIEINQYIVIAGKKYKIVLEEVK